MVERPPSPGREGWLSIELGMQARLRCTGWLIGRANKWADRRGNQRIPAINRRLEAITSCTPRAMTEGADRRHRRRAATILFRTRVQTIETETSVRRSAANEAQSPASNEADVPTGPMSCRVGNPAQSMRTIESAHWPTVHPERQANKDDVFLIRSPAAIV